MSLVQERAFIINQIRAQYLAVADDDQSRRIIRRYTEENCDPEYPTQDLGDKFNELLTRTDSPPIPINVLEETGLTRKMQQLSKEELNIIINETDEEEKQNPQFHHSAFPKNDSVIDTSGSKASHSTIKLDGPSDVPIAESGTLTPEVSQISHMGKMLPNFANTRISYKPPFTKLFRNTSGSSSAQSSMTSKRERKKPQADDEAGSRHPKKSKGKNDDDDDDDNDDDDDDDDDEYDDDDFDDDYSEATSDRTDLRSQTNTESELNNLEEIDEPTESQIQDESGILVDQNYSDINNHSQMERFNESKYLYGDNSVSSVDDQMLLDSDFSDEDEDDIIDNARLQILQSKTPSSSAPASRASNRKLSFERQSRPKLRMKRSSSLSVKEETTPTENLRHTNSISSLSGRIETQTSSGIPGFEKSAVIAKPKTQSQLTSLINKKNNVETRDPLDYYIFVSGESISNPGDIIALKVFLPHSKSLNLKVQKKVTVVETIGYILLNVSKTFQDLLASSIQKNPNKWSLQLIDEDGEPYEGSFGLMDRTKTIASYGEDEVALVEVSETEFRKNEIRTPQPVIDTEASGSKSPSPVKANPIKQINYIKSIIPEIDNNVKDSATVNLHVYKYPANDEANFTGISLPLTAKLNEILVNYTKIKGLDPTDYTLKVSGESFVLDLNDSVSSLDGSYKLEILTKREARLLQFTKKKILVNSTLPTINSNLTPQSLMMTSEINQDNQISQQQREQNQKPSVQRRNSLTSKQFSSSFSKHGISSSFKGKNSSKTQLKSVEDNSMPPNIVTTEYQKFTVWRRLPMSFINRHERTFAIDGEYVYIMPKDQKIWYENNFKTRTFHVSQIVSCKVSKRIPSNFKIVVMKTNGPKRYDFEALNPQESAEIISKLRKLMEAYKIYNSSTS